MSSFILIRFHSLPSTNCTSLKHFQRFFRSLELKSKDKDAAVPPLDETLRKITEPDSDLLSQNRTWIDELRRIFEVKENPKVIQIRMFLDILFLYNANSNSFDGPICLLCR